MTQGYDALGHPAPAAVGKGRFVAQYLKNLNRALVDAYHAAGVTVVLVYETTGQRSLGGRGAGIADGRAALTLASALGAPTDTAIYFAEDDFDVTTAEQLASVVAYMLGVKSVLGVRTGFYGGIRPVAAVAQAGAASYLWQTYAWSGGQWDPRAVLEQYLNGQTLAGTGVDFDRAVKAFGGWAPPAPAHAAPPAKKAAPAPVKKSTPPPRHAIVPPRTAPPKPAPPEPITIHPIPRPAPVTVTPPAPAPKPRPTLPTVRLAWWERALDSILRLFGL